MWGLAAAFALTTPFESGPAAELEQGRAIIAVGSHLYHLFPKLGITTRA
jgi:hypothetical protein